MRRIYQLALPVCLSLYPAGAFAADQNEISVVVDRVFASLMEEYDVPGVAVAVTIDGEHHFFSYGVSSLETKEPVTENTIFELGSVSKTFTGTLGGYAVARSKLSLDDHPSRYMPELEGSPIDKATLLHLATYTAGGLPLQFPDNITSDEEVGSYFAGWQPDAAPGETRRYSNPSIGLFGHLAARALQGNFAEILENQIFPALGLHHTFVSVPESNIASYAWGYDASNQPIRVNPGPLDAEAYGVKSSAADMIAFVDVNIRPDTLAPDLQEAVKATQVGYFKVADMIQGLGWEQVPYPLTAEQLLAGNSRTMAMESNKATAVSAADRPSGAILFNKTGSTNGFGAYVAFVPEERIGVVMLANKNVHIPARINAVHAVLEALSAM